MDMSQLATQQAFFKRISSLFLLLACMAAAPLLCAQAASYTQVHDATVLKCASWLSGGHCGVWRHGVPTSAAS